MKFPSRVLVTLLALFFVPLAQAKLDFEDNAFPEFITSARGLAMGNAYINKVDDSWSAFYNPAGLGTVRQPRFHLFNGHLEASNTLLNIVSSGPAYQIPGNYKKMYDIDNLRTELASRQGKLAHSRINLFPNITVRGLTLGYLYSLRNRGIINKTALNDFEYTERKDQGPVMSLNGSLFGGIFKVGATAVYLQRRELYKSFGTGVPVSSLTGSDYQTGRSLQLTLGTRLTLPVSMLPTFSAVVRNATNNDWEGIEGGGAPDDIRQTMDAGFSLTPQIGKTSRVHMEVNLKDVNNQYDTDIKRRLAAGLELDFSRRIFLRAGWGDGWGSGGLGIMARTFQLDLTTYAVDRSLDGFRQEEDRRFVFSFSSGF